jgi:hypothetical protein
MAAAAAGPASPPLRGRTRFRLAAPPPFVENRRDQGSKEYDVPSDSAAKRLSSSALEAFLDGVLSELREPADPDALNEVRAAFRKRVPFSMRSYAAALLILRAAGLSRGVAQRPEGRSPAKEGRPGKKEKEERGRPRQSGGGDRPKAEAQKEGERSPPRPRFAGEATTLFFSMGKRQRLYPRILIDMIIDGAKVAPESVGEVRAFDNYSFADIEPEKAGAVISALDGSEFRGRRLSVGPAKKRDAQEAAE